VSGASPSEGPTQLVCDDSIVDIESPLDGPVSSMSDPSSVLSRDSSSSGRPSSLSDEISRLENSGGQGGGEFGVAEVVAMCSSRSYARTQQGNDLNELEHLDLHLPTEIAKRIAKWRMRLLYMLQCVLRRCPVGHKCLLSLERRLKSAPVLHQDLYQATQIEKTGGPAHAQDWWPLAVLDFVAVVNTVQSPTCKINTLEQSLHDDLGAIMYQLSQGSEGPRRGEDHRLVQRLHVLVAIRPKSSVLKV
jgi:hypothetical protein